MLDQPLPLAAAFSAAGREWLFEEAITVGGVFARVLSKAEGV
jgi:hypothetical protein